MGVDTINTDALDLSEDVTGLRISRVLIGTLIVLVVLIGGSIISLKIGIGIVWAATVFLSAIALIARSLIVYRNQAKNAMRRFAQDNNMTTIQSQDIEAIAPPSFLDTSGYAKKFYNGYKFKLQGRYITTFEFFCHTGTASRRRSYNRHAAVFETDRSNPHIYLENKLTAKTTHYTRGQKFEFEGDIDKYFDAYIEGASTVESLAVLSPDVMASLIDGVKNFDIEIYENHVAVIGERGGLYTKPRFDALMAAVTCVINKFPGTATDGDTLEKTLTPLGMRSLKSYLKVPAVISLLVILIALAVIASIAIKL